MTDALQLPLDEALAAKLQAGERIWLKRNLRNIGAPAVLTLVLLWLGAMTWPRHATAILLQMPLLPLALLLGWRAMANRLRFSDTAVEASDQGSGLSQHRLLLADIIAARIAGLGLDVSLHGARNSHFCVYACQLTPGRMGGARWIALWITPYELNASTLLAELRRRCDLTQISPASEEYRTALWPEPTVWQRPGLDPTVLPVPGRRK